MGMVYLHIFPTVNTRSLFTSSDIARLLLNRPVFKNIDAGDKATVQPCHGETLIDMLLLDMV